MNINADLCQVTIETQTGDLRPPRLHLPDYKNLNFYSTLSVKRENKAADSSFMFQLIGPSDGSYE